MLGNSTVRYICDTRNLNIICIILYFDIFPFIQHYFHYNIYAIILIIPLEPLVVYYLIFTIHFSFLRPINRDY